MRYILILLFIIEFNKTGNAQDQSKFDFFAGYGFYEGLNIGSEYFFPSQKQSLCFSIGYDNFTNKDQESISILLSHNLSIFRSHTNESGKYKWLLINKAVLWQLEDKYYIWRALSFIPSINRTFFFNKYFNLSLDAGPSFNIVLYNKRKTFYEVGWPYHVMPDFRILFNF
jgi:hypothetical protein